MFQQCLWARLSHPTSSRPSEALTVLEKRSNEALLLVGPGWTGTAPTPSWGPAWCPCVWLHYQESTLLSHQSGSNVLRQALTITCFVSERIGPSWTIYVLLDLLRAVYIVWRTGPVNDLWEFPMTVTLSFLKGFTNTRKRTLNQLIYYCVGL